MNESIQGKRAIVTGAGSGIGRATAEMFAESGAKVALVSRTADELADVLQKIGGAAAGHQMHVADVSSEAEMSRVYKEIAAGWGELDAVVANAGINGVWAPLEKLEVAEWDETFGINMRGTFLAVKLALPMLKKRGGSVVIVSSVNGNRVFSNSGATAYACSKAAQVAFGKMIALELAKDGIRVNMVCPGYVETQIEDSTEKRDIQELHLPVEFPEGTIPLNAKRKGTPRDVASAIRFLASDDSAHISGSVVYVDGAQSLLQG